MYDGANVGIHDGATVGVKEGVNEGMFEGANVSGLGVGARLLLPPGLFPMIYNLRSLAMVYHDFIIW